MHELVKSLESLKNKLAEMQGILDLPKKQQEVDALSADVNKPGFWDEPEKATRKSKAMSDLQSEIDTWKKLDREVSDLFEMAKMDEADKTVNLREEIEEQFFILNKQVEKLEFNTLLNGKHDFANAIVTFQSGSGGTEAQDWAEMLLRMILRYAEKKKWKVTILDESKGSEAGIKSATVLIEGRYAFGYLKSEHGTHRLVRISPFDAEKMRHTSFALIEVVPEVEDEGEFQIDESDLRIDTFMAGGHGGQSVNTTYSAVRIVHVPTGTTVSCQNEKSQLQNKKMAMTILQSRLQKLQEEKEEAEHLKLRGEYKSPEWGNQIRNYVLHPYHMVKDVRTKHETTDDERILNGDLDEFVEAYLRWQKSQ
ncbi:MAG: peptide chain release factor 2 [Candidatus Magasanikbacteria bacterium CG_4_10_14_0_2_um_filter_37_12]|uniref:Peptide chain release factor 2 n=1 Tax=Candidatus Magasanikbacteria bacterium CG_4_10_14_0_2_um_filter_37_12 TaxID=1974637 RepID=A0A2M7V9Q4_9BACT|nr:MAG: peptide chain release factor 2 [Candidatus Magasanikbacteria bacterium CG_4_10_14_0_2_um_filter_37_12]